MKNKIFTCTYVLFLFGSIFSYHLELQGPANILRAGAMILLSIYLFSFNFNFKKYKRYILLLLAYFIIPLFLIFTGEYQLLVRNQIIYSVSFILFFTTVFSIIEIFKFSKEEFISVTFFCISFVVLISMLRNPVSINFVSLIKNMIFNLRLKEERLYMGFVNPNIAALIGLVGFIFGVMHLKVNCKNKNKTFPLFLMSAIFIFIVNTGSRTSFLTPIVSFVFVSAYYTYSKLSKYIKVTMFFAALSVIVAFFYKFALSNSLNINAIDTLTSGRIHRQLATIRYIIEQKKLIFGIGNYNSSTLYSDKLIQFNTLNTDNSWIFILLTVGLVGLSLTLAFVFSMLKTANNRLDTLFVFFTWIVSSMTENTLVVSTSLFSILFIVYIETMSYKDVSI